MPYEKHVRVIPRDLFNESKLLKCLGQLALYVHNGQDNRQRPIPACLTVDFDTKPFDIYQDPSSGDLACNNVSFCRRCKSVKLTSTYNSKSNYPLTFDQGTRPVFNDDGSLSDEFLAFLEGL